MPEIRRRRLDKAVWVPLRASQTLQTVGKRGFVGFREEFFGAGSVAVPLDKRASAETLGWCDIGLRQGHAGGVDEGRYVPADVYDGWNLQLSAIALALAQDGNSEDPPEWHLHQDFVITLRLKREGDVWLAPDEDYIEVARLKREQGVPALLEVRAEHLKDYLCARSMALYVSSYRLREEVVDQPSSMDWPTSPYEQISGADRWEGRKAEIHEGGEFLGASWAVMHITRENIDFAEDVPKIGPFDENLTTRSWTTKERGKKLLRIQGEFWRNEWIEPSTSSPRVRRDKLPSSSFFVVDVAGNRVNADKLEGTGGWLWFRPDLIVQLARHRGASLRWYTRDTGGIRCSAATSHVHFGLNRVGLVNVFAKDIGYEPAWAQAIWAGFNVGPDGGVSEELLAAQAGGEPADTVAPEEYLPKVLVALNEVSGRKFGFELFRKHDRLQALLKEMHRFRSTDQPGLFALAKDLARLTADSIDAAAIQTIVKPAKGEKWGSLRSLQELVALMEGSTRARSLVGPLFGIYELRLADAHLPSSDIEASLALAKVNPKAPFVFQGFQLLCSCVSSLQSVGRALSRPMSKVP